MEALVYKSDIQMGDELTRQVMKFFITRAAGRQEFTSISEIGLEIFTDAAIHRLKTYAREVLAMAEHAGRTDPIVTDVFDALWVYRENTPSLQQYVVDNKTFATDLQIIDYPVAASTWASTEVGAPFRADAGPDPSEDALPHVPKFIPSPFGNGGIEQDAVGSLMLKRRGGDRDAIMNAVYTMNESVREQGVATIRMEGSLVDQIAVAVRRELKPDMLAGRPEGRRSGFFGELFGFEETKEAVEENIVVEEFENRCVMTSKVNGRSFECGKFRLRDLASFDGLTVLGGGTMNLVFGHGLGGPGAELADVLQMQSLPQFDGACFMVSSTFNCLDFWPSGLGCITDYVDDHRQGPYAALAAAPSAVYRAYFVQHGDGCVGQFTTEVNLLHETPMPPHMKHGHCVIPPTVVAELMRFDWGDLTKCSVGVHENCEVTTTSDVSRNFIPAPAGRIVHQIYTSAIDFGGAGVAETDDMLSIGRQILMAEYQTSIKAAWELSKKYPERAGSRCLVLTLLGGGVSRNPIEVICEVIASCENMIKESGLQVFVVIFDSNHRDEIEHMLSPVVNSLGGRIIDTNNWSI